jgi:thiol-disulfide isomerase/thioredoxin
MKFVVILLFLVASFGTHSASSQQLKQFETFAELEKELVQENDTLYVINFWATWCAPCIKELPYFEQFHAESRGKKVKVILVSLDFKKQFESHLIPFLNKKRYTAEVVLLNDKKYNDWLDKVDSDWSGAIPATWLIQGKKRHFSEREFENSVDLNEFVNSFLNK